MLTLIDSPLEYIKKLVKDDLKKLENFIYHYIDSEKTELILKVVSNLTEAGGKKLRPILIFIIYRMLNNIESDSDYKNNVIHVASAVEFIHNATLLHDDVIDESTLRRGVTTSNNLWGNKSSILVGDFLLTAAFQWLIKCKNLDILEILSKTSYELIKGEIKQLLYTNNIYKIKEFYIEIITAKTAVLFSGACESAAVLANVSKDKQLLLKNFGMNFGIAFQITDDILDYTANGSELGKNIGDDFFNSKITLPFIFAYTDSSEEEKVFLKTILSKIDKKNDDLKEVLFYFEKYDSIVKARNMAKHYLELACKEIELFDNSIYKKALLDLSKFILERSS